MQFKFEGGRELEAALKQFTPAQAKASSRRALKKAAQPIADAWNAKAPRDKGNLVQSIIVGTRLNRRQKAMERREGSSEVVMHIGTNDPAGVQQEFGNVNHRAQPSGRPAYESEGGQAALDRISKEMWTDIEKTAARAAKKALRAG
jgi:HK97 gp10 family phage protein